MVGVELNVVDGYLDDTGQRKQLHYTCFWNTYGMMIVLLHFLLA